MFWIELGQPFEADEQRALVSYFYFLILAIVPLFPREYSGSLRSVCWDRIRDMTQEMSAEVANIYGLSELMTSAEGMLPDNKVAEKS